MLVPFKWFYIINQKIFPMFSILDGSNTCLICRMKLHISVVKHHVHIGLLYQAYAMFSADRSSQLFYQLEDLADTFFQCTVPLLFCQLSR